MVSGQTFDPYFKFLKVSEDESPVSRGSDGDVETADSVVKRTKVLKSVLNPVWREDLVIQGVEFDDKLRFEVKCKSKDVGHKTIPNHTVCSLELQAGSLMETLAQQGDNRIKLQLTGDRVIVQS